MSRKRGMVVHQAYAIVRLKCPSGHVVGKVTRSVTGRIKLHGRQFTSVEPLAVRCVNCEAAGRRLDLRASLSRIEALLDEVEPDPTRGAVDYVLGG